MDFWIFFFKFLILIFFSEKNCVRWKFNAVLGLEKTPLDRIPGYRRTALKEECLLLNAHDEIFVSFNVFNLPPCLRIQGKKHILVGLECVINVMLLLFESVKGSFHHLAWTLNFFCVNLGFSVFYPEVCNTLLDPN